MNVINPFSHVLDNQTNEVVLFLLKKIAALQEKLDLLQSRLDATEKDFQRGYEAGREDFDLSALAGESFASEDEPSC